MRRATPYPSVIDLLTGHERREASWCWRPRGTPTALLVHTLDGHGVLRVADGGEHRISAGDTLVWVAGAEHDFGCPHGADPWEIVWAHFRPREHWHDLLSMPVLGAGVSRVSAPHARVRARIDEALLEMDASARTLAPRAVDFALNALERALLWLGTANRGPQHLDDRIHEAVLFVAHRLDAPLSVRAIADAVRLSPSRLSHLFKDQVGVSPGRYVELRRIERAETLLESTSMTIGSIARATGFSSQFYFATRFKAVEGISPSDWRQRADRESRP